MPPLGINEFVSASNVCYNSATMINNLENETPRTDQCGEIGNPIDYRTKLNSFLPKLPESDANLLKNLMEYGRDNVPLLMDITNLLELNWETAQKKRNERLSAEQVDMMDILKPFNYRESIIITRNLRNWQMTDGCTGGCPQCGLRSKRRIEKEFSFDSFNRFLDKYGKYVSRNRKLVGFYRKSDPFDWVSGNGEYNYSTGVESFIDSTKNNTLITTTSVPEGSELAIIGFMIFMYSRVGEMEKQGQKRLDRFTGIRFSRKRNNKERIEKIMQTLKDLPMPEYFMKKIVKIIDREDNVKEKGVIYDKFKNVGYFANNQNEHDYRSDIVGIQDADLLVLSPSGITAESMEIVTPDNPEGVRSVKIKPGMLEIPEFLDIYTYSHILDMKDNYHSLLPKLKYRIYKNGKFTGIKTVESVGRDALTFECFLRNLEDVGGWFLSRGGRKYYERHPKHIPNFRNHIKIDLVPEYEERKRNYVSLFARETNRQVVKVATKLIGEIDDWLAHMNEKLGLSESGTLL
ncbi:MAG: hypothetical protein US48_C0022G0005 [Candidatus Levybacteria bacterium GW2011_GWA2_37_36]|nr:MAG: hypothetical protein US48_C0022G0005 [Candidatus Levybacteria bacterium GW2011_GWA2_37_36]